MTETARPTPPADKINYRFLMPLILGTMMNPLNSTMLATAMVALCGAYKVTLGQGAILITSLYVTSTIAQPLMGRLADIFSAKKINTLGFILVLIAALIGVFAPHFSWLIVSRIFLGFGTSAAYPSAMALINKKYAAENLPVPGKVLGIMTMCSQVSMVLGPVLGGLLTQWFGWQGIFLINIPWVLVALYLSKVLPDFPPTSNKNGTSLAKRLDLPGILLFCIFLLPALYVVIEQAFVWWYITLVLLLLVAFILWERTQENPFIDVRLLWNKPILSLIYIRTMAITYVLYMMLYGMPQWLEGIKHLQPARTGLMMLMNSVLGIASGLLISKSKDLFRQNLIGVGCMLLACTGLYFINEAASLFYVLGVIMCMGTAEGTNLVSNQALLNKEAPAAQKGVSFGLSRTFGYLGAITSGVQLKILFHSGITDEKFHQLGNTALYSCIVIVLLLIPVWKNRKAL